MRGAHALGACDILHHACIGVAAMPACNPMISWKMKITGLRMQNTGQGLFSKAIVKTCCRPFQDVLPIGGFSPAFFEGVLLLEPGTGAWKAVHRMTAAVQPLKWLASPV